MHYIKLKTVNEILLKSIKEITDFAKEEKQEFLKVINKLFDEKRKKSIKEIKKNQKNYHQRKIDTDKFLKMIEKYKDFEELTVPMINECIEKVVVYEATGGRKGKDRKQQVDVYFNFIGNIGLNDKQQGTKR